MRLFILFNSVFHACALKNSYVYFRSIRGAWIAAECTWIRCSAQKTEGTTGIRRPSRSKVARAHIFSCLRAKVGFFNFCAQTGKFVGPGYVYAQSPADSDGVLSFLSRAADPGAFCSLQSPRERCRSACTAVLGMGFSEN